MELYKHKTSAPFKPSSNGQAERYVATLRLSVQAMHKNESTIQQKLSIFLMQYRKAPNVTTTLSPAIQFRENNSNIQHAETAGDISKDLNKELGSSSVQGVPSTEVAVPDLSQSSAKETDSETRIRPVPDRPFPRHSGRIRRPQERLVL
ncbi:uncharacterized protein K02A2.6 [Trichonephila clavipes]|nr:uncharacterized protein K02A2.6 [Trichonephila clavipes]